MDVFSMPEVHIGKETFDCVVLCVDRHSGYVVAVPARKKGLPAKEVAVMMIRHWLTVFDIPRTICSDRGPQFTGGWLVQGHVFPHGNTSRQERRLSQPVQWPG